MADISKIEGIGESFTLKLKETGVPTTEVLLETGSTPKGRKELAEKTGIPEKRILRWVNMSDLFRVKGIGEQYSDLLEAAGVDTVPELAQRNPKNLYEKMTEINNDKNLVNSLPTESKINEWVEEAKTMPKMITY